MLFIDIPGVFFFISIFLKAQLTKNKCSTQKLPMIGIELDLWCGKRPLFQLI